MDGVPHSIAIVDDDAAVLKALGRLLRGRGFDTRTYGSAHELLGTLSERKPDCLILDLQMPEMNGLELLLHMKRQGIHVPTIIVTAHGGVEIAERCMTAGAAAFLYKPLQNSPLFAAINEASKGYRPDESGTHVPPGVGYSKTGQFD